MNKFKKSIVWMLSAFMFLSMGACGSPTTYSITWQNYDGTTLEVDNVEQGKVPTYDGAEPARNSTAEYNYTFDGWTPTIEEATSNKIYTAKFIEHKNSYTVTWDIDGAKYEEKYEYGATPLWKGSNPTKASTVEHSYSFKGWSPAIEKVTGNKTYVAEFDQTKNKYTITWDIEGVLTAESYDYGETPVYKGEKPTKPSDPQYSYVFKGWSPAIEQVTGNKTYTAQFRKSAKAYTVTWDIEGIENKETYEYGEIPTYKGETPRKQSTEQYDFEFAGWSPEISSVTQDITYTAQFDALLARYKIVYNLNGGVTSSDTTPKYASLLTSDLFFYDAIKEGYNFRGWSYKGKLAFDENGNQMSAPLLEKEMTFDAIFKQNTSLIIVSNMPEAGTIHGEGYYPFNSYVDVSVETKKDYVFVGWFYNNTLLSSQETYKHMMWNEDIILEARFKYNTYTLDVYSRQPDIGVIMIKGDIEYTQSRQQKIDYKKEVTIAAYTKIQDHRFLGWYDEEDNLIETNAVYTFTMPNYDYKLAAKWEGDYHQVIVTPTYENAATIIGAGSYRYGDRVDISLEPNEGYIFENFAYGGRTITTKSFSIIGMPDNDLQISANFSLIDYEIEYVLDGGINNPSNPLSYTAEDEVKLLNPSKPKSGFTFSKWVDEAGNDITFIPKGTTGKIKLIAVWSENPSYTFTLDAGEGQCEKTSIKIRWEDKYELPIPIIDKKELDWEYGFDCWLLNGEPIPTSGDSWTYSNVDKTLVARYKLRDDNEYLETKYEFTLNNNQYSLKKKTDTNYQYAYIPSQYNGKPVTSIGNYAFSDCFSLTSIFIPNSVTSIGGYAFEHCISLTIYCEASSKPDGWNYGWNHDRPVYWGITKHYVYNNQFQYIIQNDEIKITGFVYGVTNINIPSEIDDKKVTSINDRAFYNCSSLASIDIPNTVTSIGILAFYGCSLTSIFIPNSVTSIGSSAFKFCSSLKSVTFEENSSVTSIGFDAFYGCSALSSINIPNSVKSISYNIFSDCSSLASITIPSSVTSIDGSAFYNCSSLTSIAIPSSVTSIGSSAFKFCSSLKSVTFEENSSVTSIDDYAFSGCSSLTSITIPSSVTSIDEYAFSSCSSLTIYCEASSKPDGWDYNWNYSNRPVYWYSEEPNYDGHHWHYADGVPTVWKK